MKVDILTKFAPIVLLQQVWNAKNHSTRSKTRVRIMPEVQHQQSCEIESLEAATLLFLMGHSIEIRIVV
jgi:hypothetical protein